MIRPLRLGIAGLGTVGASVAQIVARRANALAATAGRPIRIVAISARSKGKDRGFSSDGMVWFDDPVAMATSADVDCVVELMGGDEGPARATVEAALGCWQARDHGQ